MKPRKKGVLARIKRHRQHADMPYLASGTVLGVIAVVSIALLGASSLQSVLLSSNNFAAVVSAVLVDLANSDRAQSGAGQLTVNEKLVAAAQAKANDMALKGYFAHVGPDGKEPWAWIKEAGYDYAYAGENLATRFSDSIEVEQAWLASPLHRKNILDGRFIEIGIATSYGVYQGQPTTFVVQFFGTPKAKPAPVHAKAIPQAPHIAQKATAPIDAIVLGESYAPPAALLPATAATLGEHIAASPQTYLRYGYAILSAIILLLGFLLFSYELRQHHFRHSIWCIVLCFALLALLYVADATLFSTPLVDG